MRSGQELDAAEIPGFQSHLIAHVRLFENYFAQFAQGTMDSEDWRAMREVIKARFRFAPYRSAFALLEGSWNSDFAAEINRILGEIDGPAS